MTEPRSGARTASDQSVPVSDQPATPRAETVRRERARDHSDDVRIPETVNLTRDRVRWGPIWAGLLTALTSLLVLSLLGLVIGLTAVNAGTAAAQGNLPADTGRNSAIWGAVSGLLSFLLGGYVAGRTAAVFDRGWGALNGAMVFLLGVPITLVLASMGLGGILGTLGSFAAGLNIDPPALQTAANQAQQAAPNVQPVDAMRAAEAARNGAWGALVGSLLALGASALGGALGTRRVLEVDQRTGLVSG